MKRWMDIGTPSNFNWIEIWRAKWTASKDTKGTWRCECWASIYNLREQVKFWRLKLGNLPPCLQRWGRVEPGKYRMVRLTLIPGEAEFLSTCKRTLWLLRSSMGFLNINTVRLDLSLCLFLRVTNLLDMGKAVDLLCLDFIKASDKVLMMFSWSGWKNMSWTIATIRWLCSRLMDGIQRVPTNSSLLS